MGRKIVRWRRSASCLTFVLAACALAGCTNPGNGETGVLAQNVLDLGDAVSSLRQENALLQEQIDSLGKVVARQDSAVRQIANLAGIPIPQN